MKRRTFLALNAGAAGLCLLPSALAQSPLPKVVVYKNAGCGCCGEWERHLRGAGFAVESHELADVAPVKRKLGVPETLQSCHTATVGAYVVEGHVPAGDLKRLLSERLPVRGLAVPGMPIGAPGMEVGPPEPYSTIAFDAKGSRVFARH